MTNPAPGRKLSPEEHELTKEEEPTMEEDAEALEKMYADILSVYPPVPMRAFGLLNFDTPPC